MAFDFPSSPAAGAIYTSGGVSYIYQGGVWLLYTPNPLQARTADRRNRVVNGGFQIAQEQTSTTDTGQYFTDQWVTNFVGDGTATFARIISPSSFRCGRVLVGTADTAIAAGQYLSFMQPVEALRFFDFNWGQPTAKPAVLRFSVLANNAASTGTYAVSLRDVPVTTSFVAPFSISSASTWQDVTIPIPACTGGTWATTAVAGMYLSFTFACGTTFQAPSASAWNSGNYLGLAGGTNGWGTASNGFNIANVGLYLDPTGSGVPPAWEMPDEAQELIACQRYWQTTYGICWTHGVVSGSSMYLSVPLSVVPRTTPTLTGASSTASSFPASAGTLSFVSPSVRDQRVANAANANGGGFATIFTANARM